MGGIYRLESEVYSPCLVVFQALHHTVQMILSILRLVIDVQGPCLQLSPSPGESNVIVSIKIVFLNR